MKQILQQLLKVWGEIGLNQRITLGVSAVAVIAGLSALVIWAQRPQMKLLYGRLGEKEMAEVVTALQTQNVPYELGPGGSSVFVRSDQVYKVRMALAAKGLPAADGVGFEIFDRTNFGISDFVQRTNYGRALQGELARTISQLKGVRSARVMVAIPENRLLIKNAENKPTASVFVDTGGSSLDAAAVNSIRSLVANSVEGMKADDVAVVDNRGNVLSEDLKSDPQLGTASSQIKYRRQVEEYLSGKVETMLTKVLGPGNSVVRVSADINTDFGTVTEEKFDPEGQVARSETVTEDKKLSVEKNAEKPPNPGVDANIDKAKGDHAGAGKNTEDARTVKSQTYEINRSTTNVTKSPGGVTRVTAAVFLGLKTAPAGGAATPRTPEELNEIRRMVANTLGIQPGKNEDLATLVSVQETAFPSAPAQEPVMTEKITGYAEMLRPVGALLIALAIFFVFLHMLKKTKPEEITFELVDEVAEHHSLVPASRDHKISPELLNNLIRQKPDNVGATLRGWLAEKHGN